MFKEGEALPERHCWYLLFKPVTDISYKAKDSIFSSCTSAVLGTCVVFPSYVQVFH